MSATSILQLGSFENLLSSYGLILLAKVAALIVLGFFGVIQRGYFIERMQRAGVSAASAKSSGVRWFWGFVVAELAFMGIASGLAVALARTPKPVTPGSELTTTRTPAELLTGEKLPPELTFSPLLHRVEHRPHLVAGLLLRHLLLPRRRLAPDANAATPGRSTAPCSGSRA